MSSIYKCDNHKLYFTDKCPKCDSNGNHIISSQERKKISKFLCGLLRHFPDEHNIQVDDQGWCDTREVHKVLKEKYSGMNINKLHAIVAMDNKGRYEVNSGEIRAVYGHSINVDLEDNNEHIPEKLYHGTSESALSDIMSEGLKPISRQSVHLTDDMNEARNVGSRHSDTVVLLEIDTKSLISDGANITKRGKSVYTTSHVDPQFIKVIEVTN